MNCSMPPAAIFDISADRSNVSVATVWLTLLHDEGGCRAAIRSSDVGAVSAVPVVVPAHRALSGVEADGCENSQTVQRGRVGQGAGGG